MKSIQAAVYESMIDSNQFIQEIFFLCRKMSEALVSQSLLISWCAFSWLTAFSLSCVWRFSVVQVVVYRFIHMWWKPHTVLETVDCQASVSLSNINSCQFSELQTKSCEESLSWTAGQFTELLTDQDPTSHAVWMTTTTAAPRKLDSSEYQSQHSLSTTSSALKRSFHHF